MASNYLRWYVRQSPLVLNDGEFLVRTQFSWTASATPTGSTSFTALNGGAYSISDDNRTYSYDVSHAEGETLNYFQVNGTGTVTMAESAVRSSSPEEVTYNGRNYKYLYTQTFSTVSSGGKNVAEFLQNSAENGGALPFTYNGNWVYVYPVYVRKPIVTFKDADGTVLKTEEVDAGWNVKGVATPPTLSPEKGYAASWDGDYENVTEDTTLTAKYTRTDYFVNFNGNGATAGSMAEQAFQVGATQALSANAFQKVFSVSFNFPDGATSSQTSAARFTGWAKTATSSPIWKDKQKVSVSSDMTVYAAWGRGATITLPASASIAEGKVIKWYSSNDFAESSFVGNAGDEWTPTATVTLYGDVADKEGSVSSVDKYEYVIGVDVDDEHPHGDMDRIIIDGEIMPLRTGVSATTGVERKRILRGEDVCFLMEWARQRIAAIDAKKTAGQDDASYDFETHFKTTYQEAGSFTRRVSATQMEQLFETYFGSHAKVTTYSRFVAASALAEKVVTLTATQATAYERFVDDFGMAAVEELGIDFPSFAAGDALALAKVKSLFDVATAAQDMGYAVRHYPMSATTGLTLPDGVRRMVTRYTDSDGAWNVSEIEPPSRQVLGKHYVNVNYTSGVKTFENDCIFFKSGVTLFDFHAPHAVKVVALCAFRCWSVYAKDESGSDIYKIVYIPMQMEARADKHFVLLSDGFGEDFVDELCDKYGETWETSSEASGGSIEQGSFEVLSWAVLPVVFFDDHTRIGS